MKNTALAQVAPALLLLAALSCALAACDKKPKWSGAEDQPAEAGERAGPAKKNDSIRISRPKPMIGVYRYTDDQGVINYTDDIKKVPPKYRSRARHPMGGSYTTYKASPVDDLIKKYDIDADSYKSAKPGKQTTRAPGGPVVLYSTTWCPFCKRARAYLEKRGVKFEEKDVGRSRAALEEMLRKSGGARGVPVIDVGGKIIRGFNTRALDRALGG